MERMKRERILEIYEQGPDAVVTLVRGLKETIERLTAMVGVTE